MVTFLSVVILVDVALFFWSQVAHRRHVAAMGGLIQAQRALIASIKRENRMLGEQVEGLWPLYRHFCPDAPLQPPHVEAALLVAAQQLARQTEDNNNEGGQ